MTRVLLCAADTNDGSAQRSKWHGWGHNDLLSHPEPGEPGHKAHLQTRCLGCAAVMM
jgi:hypothetical protein